MMLAKIAADLSHSTTEYLLNYITIFELTNHECHSFGKPYPLGAISFDITNMEKLTFQQLNYFCELNADKKYVADCLQVLRHEDCIFESGIIMPRDHIASLYSLRFDNAKEVGNLNDEYLMDYQDCVDELTKSKSNFLGITSVYGDNICFLIFFEPDSQIILGLLKSKSPSDIKSIEQNATDTINRGFFSSAEKYSKGTFIRDWK